MRACCLHSGLYSILGYLLLVYYATLLIVVVEQSWKLNIQEYLLLFVTVLQTGITIKTALLNEHKKTENIPVLTACVVILNCIVYSPGL